MAFGLILTEGSLAFLIVLTLVYLQKLQFNTVRNKTYSLLLIITLIFSITELITVLELKYVANETLDFILWRFHYMFCIIWFAVYYYYYYSIIYMPNETKLINVIKANLFNKIASILFGVLTIGYWFLPWSGMSYNDLDLFPNKTEYYFIPFIMIFFLFMVFRLFKNKTATTKKEKLALCISFFIFLIGFIFQAIFVNVAFVPFAFITLLFIMYFSMENPDLKVLEEINSAQGDIEKSNQTKTDFLSNMTYEIKVPMNLIMSLCDELVNMPKFDEKLVREDISQIAASGNSLLDIINNILDISKIETGKDTLQEKDYKINDLLTDVINIAKSKIGAKQVKLMVNVDQNISSVLNGDYAKLYQALINIVANAAKYTNVGRVTFTLTSTKTSGIEHLLFKVTDTGTGIKQEDQAKLFSKGTRLDNATEGEIEGSGLGLVITKQYIDVMGGKIWFDSQYRVGTTFYIDVPQKIVDATPIGNAANEEASKKTTEKLDCSKYTVLVVDDNQLNIKVAKRLLETYKFTVDSVMAGKDCVYKVKEGTKYDAIFMDHMMPEMDGIETLHVLKKLDGYELPPIIALTANAIAGMKEMYLSEGFDEYLSKPINTNELDRIVNKFFNK